MTSIVRKNTPRVSGVELVTTLLSATAVVLPLATDLLQGDDPSPRYALPLSLSLLFYSLPLSLTHSYSRRIAFFFVFAPSSLSSSCFSPFPEEETVAAFALVLRVFSLPLSIFYAEPRLARSSRVGLSLSSSPAPLSVVRLGDVPLSRAAAATADTILSCSEENIYRYIRFRCF